MNKKWIIVPVATLGLILTAGAGFEQVKPVETSDSFAKNIDNEISYYEDLDVVVETITPDDLLSDGGGDGDRILYAIDSEDKNNFLIEEFTKYDNNPSEDTKSKIREIHIPQLEKIRLKTGEPIIIRSGSRTKEHELKRGRSGKSQHIYPNGKGAVDISIPNYNDVGKLDKLEEAIISESNYTRISRYKSYLHLDFKANRYGRRSYYRNTPYGWMFVGVIN